jgi:hypothetical protein
MKYILAAFALFVAVLTSGCTVPGLNVEIPFIPDFFGGTTVNVQTADIVTIDRLDVLPSSTVRSGQSISLRAVVKNLQKPEYDAVPGIVIGLYNDCGIFDVKGEFCSGSTAPETKDGMSQCTVKMYPQSTALVEWKLTAKDVNVDTPCKIGVMAKYDYITYSTTSVTFINKAELERLVAEGKSYSETGTLSIGEGPVKPYIEVPNQPIVIDSAAGVDPKKAGGGIMNFWIENKGSGILDLQSPSSGNVNFSFDTPNAKIGIMYLQINSSAASGGKAENILAFKGSDTDLIQECVKSHLENAGTAGAPKTYSINFIGKSTPKYSCAITINDPKLVKQETTYQIMAKIWYDYKFTKETTITVQPQIKL